MTVSLIYISMYPHVLIVAPGCYSIYIYMYPPVLMVAPGWYSIYISMHSHVLVVAPGWYSIYICMYPPVLIVAPGWYSIYSVCGSLCRWCQVIYLQSTPVRIKCSNNTMLCVTIWCKIVISTYYVELWGPSNNKLMQLLFDSETLSVLALNGFVLWWSFTARCHFILCNYQFSFICELLILFPQFLKCVACVCERDKDAVLVFLLCVICI